MFFKFKYIHSCDNSQSLEQNIIDIRNNTKSKQTEQCVKNIFPNLSWSEYFTWIMIVSYIFNSFYLVKLVLFNTKEIVSAVLLPSLIFLFGNGLRLISFYYKNENLFELARY